MMLDVLAVLASLGVAAVLPVMLYGWFALSLRRFHGVVARDVLARWDAQMAELSEFDRAGHRADPPVDVLEAVLALPSHRRRRMHLSWP